MEYYPAVCTITCTLAFDIFSTILFISEMKVKYIWLTLIFLVFAEIKVFSAEKQNVLFIVFDDLNDYLGVMDGHPQALTPNIDKLAGEGFLFTNAHSNAPICAPSRASFFTGILPSTSGNYKFEKWYDNTVLNNSKTLAEYFGENGYQTFKAGKIMHHKKNEMWTEVINDNQYHGPVAYNGVAPVGHPSVPEPFRSIGLLDGTFAPLSDVPNVPATDTTPGYFGWWNHNSKTPFFYADENHRDKMYDEITVQQFRNKLKDLENTSMQPFFMALGIMRPHTPHVVPKKYYDLFPIDSVKIPVILPNDNDDCKYDEVLGGKGRTAFVALKNSYTELDEGLRAYLQSYLASVAFADDMLGQIINSLDSTRFKNNTTVVVFSDHGYNMGEKDYLFKNSLWEESTRVPLIFRIPGYESKSGTQVNHPVSLIDIYPTLKELCGLTGSTLKNISGAPLDGHSLKPFFDNPETTKWSGPDVALSVVANGASPAAKSQNYSVRSEKYRYIRYSNGSEELYDHTTDSYEWTNEAQNPAYSEIKNQLKNELIKLVPSLREPFDLLNDFSKTYSYTNLEISKDNPQNFDGDTSRVVRTASNNGTLVYQFQNIKNYKIEFWGVDQTSGNVSILGSKNGTDFYPLDSDSSRTEFGYRYKVEYFAGSEIPDSTQFLQVILKNGQGTWKGQIGSVDLSSTNPFRAASSTYYIDAENGSDLNPGTSSSAPWKTLDKVNQLKLLPGDSVLLKSGSIFLGHLNISAKGTLEHPVFFGKYGGETKPIINAAGYMAGVQILNSSNLTIKDVEIVSDAGTPIESAARTKRYGIFMSSENTGSYENFVFNNLYIHQIFASENVDGDGQNPTSNLGMGFYIVMKAKDAKIKNVHIENCRIERTGHTGIKIFGAGDSNGISYLDSVTIINNHLEHIGGPGMVPGRCNNVVVRGNVVNYSGSAADPRMHNRGSGIWPWSSKNVLIEKNQFKHAWGKYDSCGAHIDFNCSNVVIQYNLSFDNAGGFVEILGNDQNCVYRYNISINDGYRQKGVNGAGADGHIFWISGYVGSGKDPIGASNNRIYNNTIFTAANIKTGISMAAGTNHNRIENNIIYNQGDIHYENLGENNTFNNNIWFGEFPGIPFGKGAIFADPLFVNAGDTIPESYKFREKSLARGTAGSIADPVYFDFFGDSIKNGTPINRGFYETPAPDNFVKIETGVTGDGGNVYPSGIFQFPENVNLPVIIKPQNGFIIKDVLVDDISVGAVDKYVFNDLNTGHTLFADFFAPAGSITDPQDNFEIISSSSNIKIQTDNPDNFSGDTGRTVRNKLESGFIIYQFKEISDFEIEFWTYKNDNTTLRVFRSDDGVTFLPVNIKAATPVAVNNRFKTKYSPLNNLPAGVNYLKFEISGGDAAWKGQIGSVSLWWKGDERETKSSMIINKKPLKVYPNPAGKKVYIDGEVNEKQALVFSTNGTRIFRTIKNKQIDISDLIPGLYLLKINGMIPVKIMKTPTKF